MIRLSRGIKERVRRFGRAIEPLDADLNAPENAGNSCVITNPGIRRLCKAVTSPAATAWTTIRAAFSPSVPFLGGLPEKRLYRVY
jgi:hypothetical protein